MVGATLKTFLDDRMINFSELAERLGRSKQNLSTQWSRALLEPEFVAEVATAIRVPVTAVFEICAKIEAGEVGDVTPGYGLAELQEKYILSLMQALEKNDRVQSKLLSALEENTTILKGMQKRRKT